MGFMLPQLKLHIELLLDCLLRILGCYQCYFGSEREFIKG